MWGAATVCQHKKASAGHRELSATTSSIPPLHKGAYSGQNRETRQRRRDDDFSNRDVERPQSSTRGTVMWPAGVGGVRGPVFMRDCGGLGLCHVIYELGSSRSEKDALFGGSRDGE
jgi:hypothetical protein